ISAAGDHLRSGTGGGYDSAHAQYPGDVRRHRGDSDGAGIRVLSGDQPTGHRAASGGSRGFGHWRGPGRHAGYRRHRIAFDRFVQVRGGPADRGLHPGALDSDAVQASRANYRAWLSTSQLFQQGADGQEELSAAGKSLLDDAHRKWRLHLFESPIVIEGYCGGTRPADQLRISSARAILVRQYLQAHFQLDSNNLGIVSMKSSPPDGMGRTTWDGICIVV